MTTWTITFRPLPSATPVEVRIRRLLKSAGRHLDLRCIDIREGKDVANTGTPEAASATQTIDPTQTIGEASERTGDAGAGPGEASGAVAADSSEPIEATASADSCDNTGQNERKSRIDKDLGPSLAQTCQRMREGQISGAEAILQKLVK